MRGWIRVIGGGEVVMRWRVSWKVGRGEGGAGRGWWLWWVGLGAGRRREEREVVRRG